MSKVNVQLAKSKLGVVYANGCSGYVCDLLGLPQKSTHGWKRGAAVTVNDLSPGDVVGWPAVGEVSGHLSVYIGEPGCKFMDSKKPGYSQKVIIWLWQ